MPTIKIKKMHCDSAETFNALMELGMIGFIHNEFKIYDDELFGKLKQLEESNEIISRLELENTELKKKQVDTSTLIAERDDLEKQLRESNQPLAEYRDQVGQYKSEIDKLKSQGKKQSDQIQNLTKKIKSLEQDKKVLQNEKQDLLASNKELQKSVETSKVLLVN